MWAPVCSPMVRPGRGGAAPRARGADGGVGGGVGGRVPAVGEAVVGRHVAEGLRLVEGARESYVGRPGGYALLQGVGEVDPVVSLEGRRHPKSRSGWKSLRPVAVWVLEDVYDAGSGLRSE